MGVTVNVRELLSILIEKYFEGIEYINNRPNNTFSANYNYIRNININEGICYCMYKVINDGWYNNNNSSIVETVSESLIEKIRVYNNIQNLFAFYEMPISIKSLNKYKNKSDSEKTELLLETLQYRHSILKNYLEYINNSNETN